MAYSYDRTAATDEGELALPVISLKKLAREALKSLKPLSIGTQNLFGKEPKGTTKGMIAYEANLAHLSIKHLLERLNDV